MDFYSMLDFSALMTILLAVAFCGGVCWERERVDAIVRRRRRIRRIRSIR